MALSAVLLPAPLGPIRPRMRPSSTFRSMPSTATVFLKALRRPRASITAICSALPAGLAARSDRLGAHELFGRQAQPADGGGDLRPLLLQELLALGVQQQLARAVHHEHAE